MGTTTQVTPLPSTGAVTGLLEALAFFRDPDFASRRFAQFGDVFETRLVGQQLVFIRGGQAISDLLAQPEATEGWWPESVKQLLGSRSLANRNGADHHARRRAVGQLFSAAALKATRRRSLRWWMAWRSSCSRLLLPCAWWVACAALPSA
jgi:cytochrome P450